MARLKEYIEGPVPSYMLEDVPDPYRAQAPSYTLEDFAEGPTPDAVAKIAKRSSEMRLDSPIPTASAPPTRDAAAPVVSTQPAVTSTSPAGKPESMGTPGLPAPQTEPDMRLIPTQDLQAASRGEGASALAIEELARRGGGVTKPPIPEGAGGDADEERNLYLARLIARNAASFGAMGAGKSIDTGAVETLGERLKQVQALRAKREEKALGDVEERSNLNAAIDSYKQLFPDQADALERMRGSTNKPAVLREQLNAWRQMMEWEKAKKPLAQATIEQKEAGRDLARAKTPEVALEGESKRRAREQAAALGWARLSAQSAEAAARAAADVAKSGASATEQRAVDEQLGRIEKIIKGAGYTPLIASLEQADQAIAALGRPPTTGAQIKHSVPGGDRFLSPQEKAYFNSVDKLKQMEQLAISGKVVSVQEREEFIKEYGTNWYANPTAAAAYIDMLRKKTARQIDLDLASVRASPSGQLAIDAYAKAGGITSALPVFKGAGAVSTATGPTESQIAKLKARPDMAAEFDKKFGPGAAAKILGGP